MAREGELKRIDLKVNVSCCEGCRRKVMKAMSLKGVLRTEIQPSHDRVTVVGDVDAKVLVKKLSKVGKIVEVLPPASHSENCKRREEGVVKDSSDDRPAPEAEEKSGKGKDDGKGTGGDKAAAACEEGCKKCAHKAARACAAADGGSGDHHASGKAAASRDVGADARSGEGRRDADGSFSGKAALAPDHAAPAPQVQMQQHYHRAEPAMVVPVHVPAYYPPVAAPAPYYGGYYPMPPPPPMPMPMLMGAPRRQLRPQPSRFDEDYFNDDNTIGCRVM
ncbi:hypothetical protein SEVIR_7G248100v4 [Setaria viridis]|uniref:HMA domain-containing protein n=1 Tax=Setaria viridis TaxID=4556 RepID=A0A4U6TUI5_SETVI|nr:uncharacterized protein LOC117865214 [Setaria viridis]TKW06560.1 hypothetical protein SEVIR_7G248100v2 [Setaria viridis]